MSAIPNFVLRWAREVGLKRDEIHGYLAGQAGGQGDREWDTVSEELSEDKYDNLRETVLRHMDSGRFVRVVSWSQPYGCDGEFPEEEDDTVEEVFPREIIATVYESREEIRRRKSKQRSNDDSGQ